MTGEPTLSETGRHQPRPAKRAKRRTLFVVFTVLGAILVAGILSGLRPRLQRDKVLLAESQATGERRPVVTVVPAHAAPSHSELELPGDLQAFVESPIFARADGYLRRRLVDIGDHVKKGQMLAEIETPELDQQISQARATLSQSRASLKQLQAGLVQSQAGLKLAKVTYERWKELAERGVFSRQDADEKQAAFEVKRAEVEAAQANIAAAENSITAVDANLRRLLELKSFDTVAAPFDGIVTARNVDVGTLINAGSGGASKEMFRVAQIETLRIFVNVPQTFVSSIRPDQAAELRVQELPGRVFAARVERTANSLDANSRTMLVVLDVPNPRGVLLPGMYAQMKFNTVRDAHLLLIPSDALVLGRSGPQAAVVGADGRAHYQPIRLGRDFGAQLEVTSGLSDGDLVILHPTDEVRENVLVEMRRSASP